MSDAQRAAYATRETVLLLLSDEENAKVSNAEAALRLEEGEELLDLEHLDRGVQRAEAVTSKATMGHILPRSAVSGETWSKIIAHLAGEDANP
jgi:hypothetical protein